jgi:hypothetical protein
MNLQLPLEAGSGLRQAGTKGGNELSQPLIFTLSMTVYVRDISFALLHPATE